MNKYTYIYVKKRVSYNDWVGQAVLEVAQYLKSVKKLYAAISVLS